MIIKLSLLVWFSNIRIANTNTSQCHFLSFDIFTERAIHVPINLKYNLKIVLHVSEKLNPAWNEATTVTGLHNRATNMFTHV